MKILWTPRAAEDLEQIVEYIATKSSDSATRVADRIYTEIMELTKMPEVGRLGGFPGTRELVFTPWPYIAVYRVTADAIRILRVRHAAQSWL